MTIANASIQFLLLIIMSPGFLPLQTVKLGSCGGSHNVSCRQIERNALLNLKQGIKDPSDRLSSWVSQDCCKWAGVRCSNKNNGHVTKLKLGNMYSSNIDDDGADGAAYALGGDISHSLLDLKHLMYLDLSRNSFGGIPIPDFFGSLRKLSYLNLSSASFGGTIPSHLGNLSSLIYLDLSSNGFNSSLPHWLFNLSSLVYLNLSSNSLQGEFPEEFGNISLVQYIDLSGNYHIGGKLPGNLGKLWNLRVLDLSYNNITGGITEVINGFAECRDCELESLQLEYNKLGGFLPHSLGQLSKLEFLGLRGNSFLGSIPESIGNLSSLKTFYLSSNQMTGTIPVTLGKLSALVVLDLSLNQWECVITEAHLSNLTSLKELAIAQSVTNITLAFKVSSDWIPPFKLSYLYLKSCELGPEFPAWLRTQNKVNSFVLMNARISGPIPEWFWKLDLLLSELDLSNNQLSGRVTNTLKLKFLPQSTVFLNNNSFTGPLPMFSSNVSSLHLDNNLFSGPIPLDIGERMPMLTDLDVSSNALSGSIPRSIGKLTSLMTLVVSNNHLTGKIPGFWNTLPDVFVIDMSNNSLSGNIPRSLGSLSLLMFLMLSNNKLSGELPADLQNCTVMQTLDLGYNRISGKFPSWIGEKMPSLLIISLRSNLFHGDIPRKLCSLSSLHILDLADNKLSGAVPSCIGNMSGMKSVFNSERYEGQLWVVTKGRKYFYMNTLYLVDGIDLSSNNLRGEVPVELTNLPGLFTLNLSANHLTGKIPANIGNLQRLETLDLSRNHLDGTIPASMASITSLSHLNLSYNNLSGKIPSTNQFLTFNDPSIYGGNPALCGLPLSTKCDDKVEVSHPPGDGEKEDGGGRDKLWFYAGLAMGFAVGFWGVLGTLIVKKTWRHAYFRFIDEKKERLFVFVLLNLARLRRLMKE